jgi:hypothetical protein
MRPLLYAKAESQAAPTCSPAGYAFTKSAARTPFPASWRHKPGQPRRGTLPVFPTHALEYEHWPYVILTFSSSVIWPTRACAFWKAAAHGPAPSAGAAAEENELAGSYIVECVRISREGKTVGDEPQSGSLAASRMLLMFTALTTG